MQTLPMAQEQSQTSPKPNLAGTVCLPQGQQQTAPRQGVTPACCRAVPHQALALYLHPGLHHIQGSVAEDTRSSSNGSKHPCYEGVNGLVGIVP